MDSNSFGLKCTDPLHEVGSIIIIVSRVELPASPGVKRLQVGKVINLHPSWRRPWRTHDLDIWVDGEDLLEDGYHITGFFFGEGKVLNTGQVAAAILTQ